MTIFGDAIDNLFEDAHLAEAGLWRIGGAGPSTQVRVVIRRPDRIANLGETRVVASTVLIEMRVAEAPTLTAGDTIEVGGVVYFVQGEPLRDAALLIWTAEARPV